MQEALDREEAKVKEVKRRGEMYRIQEAEEALRRAEALRIQKVEEVQRRAAEAYKAQ